jgi:hypothetical protein
MYFSAVRHSGCHTLSGTARHCTAAVQQYSHALLSSQAYIQSVGRRRMVEVLGRNLKLPSRLSCSDKSSSVCRVRRFSAVQALFSSLGTVRHCSDVQALSRRVRNCSAVQELLRQFMHCSDVQALTRRVRNC